MACKSVAWENNGRRVRLIHIMKNKSEQLPRTTIPKCFSASIITIVLLLFSCVCFGDDFKPDMQGIIRDTQKLSMAGHQLNLVWWVPKQYWQGSLESSQKLTPEAIGDFLKTVKPYTVIMVVKGQIGAVGGITYDDEATIRSQLVLVDHDGNEYTPMNDSAISDDAKNLIGMMKPIFANMLGSMGKNMDFYLFPALDKNGRPIADAAAEGQFSVRSGGETFKWRLPIGSVLPAKICPKCGEKLSGAYKFCPYDGTPLNK